MRFAAIADIHGNAVALEAVLADIAAQAITDIVNLGDHLSGPLEAGRTADILVGLDLPSVLGRSLMTMRRCRGARPRHRLALNDTAPSETTETFGGSRRNNSETVPADSRVMDRRAT